MKLEYIDIMQVWTMLGGGHLRGGRGQAFWRDGKGYNVSLEPDKGAWFDHRDGVGGGILDLAVKGLGSRQEAIKWLQDNCGLDAGKPMEDKSAWVKFKREEECARYFRVSLRIMSELALDTVSYDDPERQTYTDLIRQCKGADKHKFLELYRSWAQGQPDMTRGLVASGRKSLQRTEKSIMDWIDRIAPA